MPTKPAKPGALPRKAPVDSKGPDGVDMFLEEGFEDIGTHERLMTAQGGTSGTKLPGSEIEDKVPVMRNGKIVYETPQQAPPVEPLNISPPKKQITKRDG